MFQENWQKLLELQQGLLGIDNLAHHSRVSELFAFMQQKVYCTFVEALLSTLSAVTGEHLVPFHKVH